MDQTLNDKYSDILNNGEREMNTHMNGHETKWGEHIAFAGVDTEISYILSFSNQGSYGVEQHRVKSFCGLEDDFHSRDPRSDMGLLNKEESKVQAENMMYKYALGCVDELDKELIQKAFGDNIFIDNTLRGNDRDIVLPMFEKYLGV